MSSIGADHGKIYALGTAFEEFLIQRPRFMCVDDSYKCMLLSSGGIRMKVVLRNQISLRLEKML
jgi:hypothetical protein